MMASGWIKSMWRTLPSVLMFPMWVNMSLFWPWMAKTVWMANCCGFVFYLRLIFWCTLHFLHAGYAQLAEEYDLLKLGGSDYHAKGYPKETDVGGCPLPPLAMKGFLAALNRCHWRYIRHPYLPVALSISNLRTHYGCGIGTNMASLLGGLSGYARSTEE